MSEENFKIYSGKRCEKYYKKYNLVSAVHKIIDLEDIIKEVRLLTDDFNMEKYDYKVPSYLIYELLDKENIDIELDMLKALNTDLDDDVEMG